MNVLSDILSKLDIEILVDQFYEKVLKDDILSPFFSKLDFDQHKPRMVHFWSFVLLDEAGYTTDVTEKHMSIRLKKVHFDRWISLFNVTVDTLYKGEKAELAKQRAFLIRWTIESKMNKNES
ncbi:MAG: group III truncated hemoglobin [Crocinitomicaceae bacterium]